MEDMFPSLLQKIKDEFEKLNAVIIGISKDSLVSHKKFIDLVYLIKGEERIGIQPYSCRQEEVEALWDEVTPENFKEISDYAGARAEFMQLNGFDFDNVDYDADVDLDELAKLVP